MIPWSGCISEPPSALRPILTRRSVNRLTDPGPTREQIELLIQAAATVPDHGLLRPWRFVVIRGQARESFGDALGAAAEERSRLDGLDRNQEKVRGKVHLAPALIAVVFSPIEHPKVPRREQLCSASCTGFAIALAAHCLGLGAVWKSAEVLDGSGLRRLLDLGVDEELLGWINVGRALAAPTPRQPPAIGAHAQELSPAGVLGPLGTYTFEEGMLT